MKINEYLKQLKNRPPLTKKQILCKIVAALTLVLAIILDVVTKKIVVDNMALYEEIPVIKGVFHWKYIQNRGAAFGMLADNREVFLVISSVAIVVMAIYLLFTRTDRLWWMIGIGMLVGGGIGNMIDRIALGYVVDFIYVALIDFAVFNVADCFVCVGVALLMYLSVLDLVREYKEGKTKKALEGDKKHDGA
ncbi:MAG: signal peptidase II [Clostridia bacterium]|nr:signal peptidase II [Clostridia bacterium]